MSAKINENNIAKEVSIVIDIIEFFWSVRPIIGGKYGSTKQKKSRMRIYPIVFKPACLKRELVRNFE